MHIPTRFVLYLLFKRTKKEQYEQGVGLGLGKNSLEGIRIQENEGFLQRTEKLHQKNLM